MSEETKLIVFSLLALLCAAVFAFASGPLVMRFSHLVGAIDVPKDSRRMHKKPMPRLGGLSILVGFLAALLIFDDISMNLRGVLLGAVVIVVLGVIDDITALSAWVKGFVQIAAVLIPILHGVKIERFSNPFVSGAPPLELGIFAIPVTVVWIMGVTNAVNLIDGLDGLAAGVSAIASISLLAITIICQQSNETAIIMAALAGACLGFLPYNFNPARMFMGDTGATFLGYILATTSIFGLFKFYTVVSFAVPFLVLGLPIFDTMSAIIRRVKNGKNPMSADREHVHHKLIDMGFSQKQSVTILYAVSILLGFVAVLVAASGQLMLVFLLASAVIAAGIAFRIAGRKSGASNAVKEEEETGNDE